MSYYSAKINSNLNMMVAAVKKAEYHAASKVSALNKLYSSAESGVQGGYAPDCRDTLEETEVEYTMGMS